MRKHLTGFLCLMLPLGVVLTGCSSPSKTPSDGGLESSSGSGAVLP